MGTLLILCSLQSQRSMGTKTLYCACKQGPGILHGESSQACYCGLYANLWIRASSSFQSAFSGCSSSLMGPDKWTKPHEPILCRQDASPPAYPERPSCYDRKVALPSHGCGPLSGGSLEQVRLAQGQGRWRVGREDWNGQGAGSVLVHPLNPNLFPGHDPRCGATWTCTNNSTGTGLRRHGCALEAYPLACMGTRVVTTRLESQKH